MYTPAMLVPINTAPRVEGMLIVFWARREENEREGEGKDTTNLSRIGVGFQWIYTGFSRLSQKARITQQEPRYRGICTERLGKVNSNESQPSGRYLPI
jgi:hypothetical protein